MSLTSFFRMSVSFHISERKSWRVVTLTGRVDAFSDRRVLKSLRQSLPQPAELVFDLSQCEFLSTWALQQLELWAAELKLTQHHLSIFCPTDAIRRQLNQSVKVRFPVFFEWEALEIEAYYRQGRTPAIFAQI